MSAAAGTAAFLDFLSIVGGEGPDALFRLSEFDKDVFVVIGTTEVINGTGAAFPLLKTLSGSACSNSSGRPQGVAMAFVAPGATGPFPNPTSSLLLLASMLLDSASASIVPRDVLCHGGRVWIVGETSDTALPTTAGFQTAFGGGSMDGFVLCAPDPSLPIFTQISYFGGAGDDMLSGVSGWNEYPDHVAVGGRVSGAAAGDVTFASLFLDTAWTVLPAPPGSPPVPPLPPTQGLMLLRSGSIVDAADTATSGVPPHVASVFNPTWLQFSAGPAGFTGGGGVAVNPQGQVMLVGYAKAPGFGSPGSPAALGRPYASFSGPGEFEGFRAICSTLPHAVCSSDATECMSTVGGTTPSCGLSAFGRQVGVSDPVLQRMRIDVQGEFSLSSTNAAILVDRPPAASAGASAILQVGFPSSPPQLLAGIELWQTGSVPVVIPGSLAPDSSARILLAPLGTLSVQQFTVQWIVALSAALPSPQPCPSGFVLAASPALLFSY